MLFQTFQKKQAVHPRSEGEIFARSKGLERDLRILKKYQSQSYYSLYQPQKVLRIQKENG